MKTTRHLALIIITLLLLNLSACAQDGVAGKYECRTKGYHGYGDSVVHLNLNSDGTFHVSTGWDETTGKWQRKGDEVWLEALMLTFIGLPSKLKIDEDTLVSEPWIFTRVASSDSAGKEGLLVVLWGMLAAGLLSFVFLLLTGVIKIPWLTPSKPPVIPSTGKPQAVPPGFPLKSDQSAAESKPSPVDIKPSVPEPVSPRAETPIGTKPPVAPEVQPKSGDVRPGTSQPVPPPVEMKPAVSPQPQPSSIDVQPSGPVIIPAPIAIKDSERQMSPAKAKLVVVQTGRVGQEFGITKDSVDIGRLDPDSGVWPDIDLTLDDPATQVSRKHARIFFKDGKYFIEDLGSTNGTFVNKGPRLGPGAPQELKHGDEIVMGRTFLTFLT